jgi:DNA-binding NarL/FixJ family response regulator
VRKEIYYRLCSNRYFDEAGAMVVLVAEPPALLSLMKPIRVALADGHPLAANGLLKVARDNENIVFDGYIFQDKFITSWYDGSNADVLLLDISTPVPNAITVVKDILCRFPEAKIIILSDEDDPGVIRFIRGLGVCGYHIKTTNFNDTIETILKVYNGEKVFPEDREGGIARLVTERFTFRPCADLSMREIQVLKLIARGKTNPQIAAELQRSAFTVKTHRQKLLKKLNACNTAQLISKARIKGLL